MEKYSKKIEIRWADLDPNFHVLHSKYYDFGAYCRMAFLVEHGVTPELIQQYHIAPIIFREECLFRKEIRFGDEVTVTLMLDKVSGDHRKWTMVHELWKQEDTIAAIITVDGAWMDTVLRKLATPPAAFMNGIDLIPKTAQFRVVP
jgi:acyl-CoA thioester hydrolase